MGQESCDFKGHKMSINDSPGEFISNAGHSPNITSAYEADTSHDSDKEFSEHCSNVNND